MLISFVPGIHSSSWDLNGIGHGPNRLKSVGRYWYGACRSSSGCVGFRPKRQTNKEQDLACMSKELYEKYNSSESSIETFLRIRPSKVNSGYFQVDDIESNRLHFRLPLHSDHEVVNNSRTHYTFQFNGILDENSDQDDVFQSVGLPAAKSVLEGFNATIFAYGQTGSGKTFTITGGPERYVDRGIIPRSIHYLFNEFQLQKEKDRKSFTCYVSYLEIYNENGFDLLKKNADDGSLRHENPKVVMLEDEDGQLHFRNLSVHKVESEEDALNLLFVGDTNRAIGETAMNQASSRSHCIFTLMIECRKDKGDTLVRSKLNLVDLAGSERVHKTFSAGQTLKEAQFINQSLFFLEMVIVALHEKSLKGDIIHIPYRNSMMTSVLRDSIGGNCKTIMIATMSPERDQTDESISTCHFAQRVALVKNQAYVNEEVQPEFVIQRLKQEIVRLREEVRFLNGEDEGDEDMTVEKRQKIEQFVREYIENDDERRLDLGKFSLLNIHTAFSILKKLLNDKSTFTESTEQGTSIHVPIVSSESTSGDLQSQIISLKRTLKQRDKEIAILVNMIKKGHGSNESDNLSEEFDGVIKETNNDLEKCDPVILNDAAAAFSWFCSKHPAEEKMLEEKEMLRKYIAEVRTTIV
jgi:kinesin family protein 6/9